MDDRRTVRSPLLCGVSIELVVEDGANRAVGERADLDGVRCSGFQPCDAERPRQPQDAEAGSEALLGMGSLLQDEIAERRGCRADEGGVPADAADGPVGVAAMTGWHVVGCGGVLAIAAAVRGVSDSRTLPDARPWRVDEHTTSPAEARDLLFIDQTR